MEVVEGEYFGGGSLLLDKAKYLEVSPIPLHGPDLRNNKRMVSAVQFQPRFLFIEEEGRSWTEGRYRRYGMY